MSHIFVQAAGLTAAQIDGIDLHPWSLRRLLRLDRRPPDPEVAMKDAGAPPPRPQADHGENRP